MTEQLVVHRYEQPDDKGLSWPRIVGIAFVIALHLAAFMMLLIPAVAPKAVAEKERNVMVTIVDAPPPPPPPPPPPQVRGAAVRDADDDPYATASALLKPRAVNPEDSD